MLNFKVSPFTCIPSTVSRVHVCGHIAIALYLHIHILRLYFFIVAQIAEIVQPGSQCYSNGPGNLGSMGSNKEIQPNCTITQMSFIITEYIESVFFFCMW